ncbi:hypothetical protein RRG08_032809 [Elysia crispata]|uniref:Uncharacterized protein n=1 Tax=Elysia crispata TaxID=231223 RepID=A0AAE0YNM4_9GAST|nr:hypothetical protein RRG08_032809 [Elysia crispata]
MRSCISQGYVSISHSLPPRHYLSLTLSVYVSSCPQVCVYISFSASQTLSISDSIGLCIFLSPGDNDAKSRWDLFRAILQQVTMMLSQGEIQSELYRNR